MEENVGKKPETDVRLLSLKRWNFPQTTCLFPTDRKEVADTENYISYNSHHFIHIEECSQQEVQAICSAYNSLKKLRDKQRSTRDSDLHMIQSMTLLGEKGDFWETPREVLYISFLQLTNDAVITIDEIRKEINEIITRRASGASWALYHSLDFCDLVLFTKGLTYDACSQIMWDLSVVRGEKLKIFRDAFTIYGFHQEFLKDAFQKLNQNKCPKWKDNASLSIQLSIQSFDVWQKLENSLKEAHIGYTLFRTFGRYDVRLVTDTLPGEQVLKLLYLLDGMAKESTDRAFGGYEISMEAAGKCTIQGMPTDTSPNRELEKTAAEVMDLLCSQSAEADLDSADYVDETRCSLEALLKNGFSEEFVLSVLPTFLGFLQINIDVESYRKQTKLAKAEEQRLKESQEKMTRYYFNSLNTLALCTMHSDRQFIQAPAFNAMYFDVPPKLLAFYSAIVREIQDSLKATDDADYHFLIVPNYQKDINVRVLELEMNENLSHHIAIAHLHESYFYDPVLTIKLFCHEAAHYLSNRYRDVRAIHIFRVVSYLLLANNTPLLSLTYQTGNDSILVVLAESLADYLMKKFNEQKQNSTRNIPFHLNDIRIFLITNKYGTHFFSNPFDIHQICIGWQRALQQKVTQKSDSFDELFCKGLDSIQQTLQSNLFTELFKHNRNDLYVYEVFSRIIAYYASLPYETPDRDFDNINEQIITTFSEAYADLRMCELLGDEFSQTDYEKMFLKVDTDYRYYQRILRHDTVLMTVMQNHDWKKWIPDPDDEDSDDENCMILPYVADQIHQYLAFCHETPVSSQEVVQVLQDLKEDAPKQYERIRETIQKYRVYLTDFCNSYREVNPPVAPHD